MIRWWMEWGTAMAISLRFGLFHMVERLFDMALLIALATLESLGIQYGVRTA